MSRNDQNRDHQLSESTQSMSEYIDTTPAEITKAIHEFGEQLALDEKVKKEHEEIRDQLKKEAEQYSFLKDDTYTLKLDATLRETSSQVLRLRDELEYMPIKAGLHNWLVSLHEQTRKQYCQFIAFFFDNNIMHDQFADGHEFTIGGFRHVNHSLAISRIHAFPQLENEKKEAMIQCYTAFVSYLDHISYGWLKRALVLITKTDSVTKKREGFSLGTWRTLIEKLDEINERDSILLRCLMGSNASLTEVLDLKFGQVDWENNCIRFIRKKQHGIIKEISTTYPKHFMRELKEYYESTTKYRKDPSDIFFITKNNRKITRSRLNYSLAEASTQAGINKKISPFMLKKIWTALIQEGIKETAIIRSKKWSLYETV